jgi:hypothetical protein
LRYSLFYFIHFSLVDHTEKLDTWYHSECSPTTDPLGPALAMTFLCAFPRFPAK